MSTSKHIDVICVVVIVLSLLVTILFMNGEKLGVTPIQSEETDSSYFTANDLNGSWDTSGATRITLSDAASRVSGGGAYVLDGNVHIVEAGRFVLSGTLSDGSVIVDAGSSDKVWMLLDGASITCADTAALDIEQAGKVFLTLAEESENTIASGASYTDEAVENGVDGAVYSRDDLTINGSGALTVKAEYKHGIVCNDDFVVTGGTIAVTAKEDAVHANDSGRFTGMTMTLTAGDDGVTVSNDEGTGYIYMQSGSLTVTECYEGLEAVTITVAGGDLNVTCSDDGLNANGGSESMLRVTGGNIRVLNSTGRDADGFDSNGSISIEGGTVFISLIGDGSNGALDCGTENGGTCTVSGGTVIACGGASMAEGFDSTSTQCSLLHTLSSTVAGGAELALQSAGGTDLVRETIPNAFSCVVLSTPDMALNETYTLTCGSLSEDVTLTNTATSNAGGGMQGGFGGGMRGGFGRQTQSETDTANESRQNSLLPDDDMLVSRVDVEGGSETDRQNGFGGRGMRMFGGEKPSMADGEMPSMPDGEMPSMAEGASRGDFGGKGGMQGGVRGESTTEAEETVNAAEQPQTWILVGASALVLLVGLAFVLLFKDRSDSV